jgi:hypothetical protein
MRTVMMMQKQRGKGVEGWINDYGRGLGETLGMEQT